MAARVAHDRRVIDLSSDFGAHAARRLREEVVVWLTTVGPGGAPLPTPVWFLWDGEQTIHVRSLPSARRVEHIEANEHVALHFDGNGEGGDIVVLSGRARIEEGAAPADRLDGYVEKYADRMAGIGLTPEQFAERYSAPIRIELTRLRGH
jgi:PPOX class probable F420-dependent enzyme